MGKGKKIKTEAPKFFEDPVFKQGVSKLSSLGNRLTDFDFTGDLAPLAQTTDLDPQVTKDALNVAQSQLQPAFEDALLRIKNEAAAGGSLTSSTFGDALSREAGRLTQNLQGITSAAALDDRQRALENRIRLFGSGANLIGSATTFAGQNQQQRRSFNQQDFENQIALEKANAKGGFAGGLKGAIGGGIAGFALGGPIGAAAGAVGGGLIGGFGGEGTGSSILNASTSLASGGFGKLGKTSGSPSGRVGAPRSAASNDPFSEFNFDSIPRELLRF